MELLRLLTLGRLGGGGRAYTRPTVTTTIATRVVCQDPDEGGGGGGEDDDGPFFDLEFTVPLRGSERSKQRQRSSFYEDEREGGGGGGSCGSSLRRDQYPVLSSPYSGESKPPQLSPGFFLKFRVFKLGFHRKSRSATSSPHGVPAASPAATPRGSGFFVRFKMEEAPPASFFTRDSSWRSSSSSSSGRSGRLFADDGSPAPEERKLLRYLSKIKPLYIRVISKRHGDKLRSSDPTAGKAGGRDQTKELPLPASAVCRRLRKSRSASAAVTSVRSPPMGSGRRDDSLLEQQDGIQSAIAHCKRSFNRGTESPLLRSRSHPGDRIVDDDI